MLFLEWGSDVIAIEIVKNYLLSGQDNDSGVRNQTKRERAGIGERFKLFLLFRCQNDVHLFRPA